MSGITTTVVPTTVTTVSDTRESDLVVVAPLIVTDTSQDEIVTTVSAAEIQTTVAGTYASLVVVGSTVVTTLTASQGPQGLPGTSGTVEVDESLISLEWGTPSAETANAIEITGSIKTLAGAALASSVVDVQVIVSDGATDCEPSATATLSAAGTPVGTVLAGSGTATLTIRSNAGSLSIRASETAAAHRYLWLRNGGHQRLWVRSLTGVQELVFA